MTSDERVREGVEHLQVAALEVIAAVRSFLDVAEEVVRDRAALGAFVQTVGDTVGDLVTLGTSAPAKATDDATSEPGPTAAAGGVTRIRVS